MAEKVTQKEAKPPKQGESTKLQTTGGVYGLIGDSPGFTRPPAGTFEVYRKMRGNPTIALARIATTAPIRTAEISFEAKDKATDEQVKFIDEEISVLWPMLLKEMLLALDYGFQSFEKVFQPVQRESRLFWTYRKLKPLRPEKTKILQDTKTGSFSGLKQGDIELGPEKSFVFTYDGEAGNPYGRSRHENVRETAWHQWNQISQKAGQYATKISGIIPYIEYPEGESKDASGSVKSNFELAQQVLTKLGQGNGVAMPNVLAQFANDLARSGVDVEKLKAWHISFLEAKGNHSTGFVDMMKHRESLMMRGWLVPERTAIEGTNGTKAEAVAHADISLLASDLLLQDIVRYVNWYVVNPLLVYNFGPDAENSVYIKPGSLSNDQKSFYRNVISAVLANPQNSDLFVSLVGIDSLLDQVGLPKAAEDVTDIATEKASQTSQQTREDNSTQPTPEMTAAIRTVYKKLSRKSF